MQSTLESIAQQFGGGLAWLLMSLMIFLRYAIPATLVFLLVYRWKRKRWFFWKIQQKFPQNKQIQAEIYYSMLTSGIFAGMAIGVYFLRKMGYGELYFNISDHGWGYYFFSIAFMIVVHDTYFYFMHRLMHHPKLFKMFHLVHHQSSNPTPYTSFSFHPLESVVEFGIVPLLAIFMPIHFSALMIFTLWSIAFNVMGHTGYEFSPSGFTRHWFFKWFNTPTHHNMHHSKSGYNYGLYFNFWDRVMGTNHPDYEKTFEQIKARTRQQLEAEQQTQQIQTGSKSNALKTGMTAIMLLSATLGFSQLSLKDIKNGQYGTPESRTEQADGMMQQGLQLNREQSTKIHDINLRYSWRTENEVVHQAMSDWSKYRKIMAIQKDKDAELKGVLDGQQFEKYEQKRDELFWEAVKTYFF